MSEQTKTCVLPKISHSNDFWFKSVELIFTAASYTDDEMHDRFKDYLLDNELLPRSWDDNVKEFVLDPIPEFPLGRRYLCLKEYFLGTPDHVYDTDEGDEFQGNQLTKMVRGVGLLSCRELRPSAFLETLNKVFGGPKYLRRTFWLARLPRKIQKVLFAAILLDPRPFEDRTLEDLAAVADAIAAYEKYHSQPRTNKRKITLPDFRPNDPELWFYLLDEAFAVNGVGDDQLKFEYTVDMLQTDELLTAALFLTDLPNQPETNKYANLKERIIKTFDVIKNDGVYSFVFRITMLTPYPLYKLLNDMAVKSNSVIPKLLIRTFWLMLLPIKTQTVLFELWTTSRETLQDLDIEALALVADSEAGTQDYFSSVGGHLAATKLDKKEVDNKLFQTEMHAANTFQKKIEFGMKYCDFMYRTYYKNNPSESIKSCTVFRTPFEKSEYTAKDFYYDGCDCWYHDRFGEDAKNCMEVQLYKQ